ncbi:MAG: preprotein translocase subunit SecA [Gemmataceae bacterium]
MTPTTASPASIHIAGDAFTRLHGKNRLGSRLANYARLLFGLPSQRRLARGGLAIAAIRHFEAEFSKLSDTEVRQRGLQLRGRARGGESLDSLLPEAFALTCVAAYRNVRLRPFDVQLAAGVVLHHGALAEVATGEGKTLIATLPVALNALMGKGVHVTTVNDYLALRDGEWTGTIYQALGLTTGVLQMKMTDEARTEAYQADITYGTASEFGFDFLRDRLKQKSSRSQGVPFWMAWSKGANVDPKKFDPRVQREHHYALVDEADNIFVDEARTPLIISMPTRLATEQEAAVYHWADGLAKQMVRDQHFYLDEKKQKVELTDLGRGLIRYSNPPTHTHAVDKLHEHAERAIHANYRFRLDQHYLIENQKVVIIDEFTGRRMPDRHWREGLHQAVEAKEKAPITFAADHAAQVTYQSYFRLYKKLSGMSGTAKQNWRELRRVYKLRVVCVPTNKPCVRVHQPDRVFPTEDAKMDAVVAEVQKLHAAGRPILIGTRSVEKSELLGRKLSAAGVEHQVLNARPDIADREAAIVAQAGRPGVVTIATNMAGRGTDILLGGNPETMAWVKLRDQYKHRNDVPPAIWKQTVDEIEAQEHILGLRDQVRTSGGLHVLGTERHEALRIDRQLQGRAARQGDPGSAQFFLSLEDELLEGLGPGPQESLREIGERGGKRDWDKYHPYFIKAQRRLEARHYRQRVDLLLYERNRQEILKDLGADPYVD